MFTARTAKFYSNRSPKKGYSWETPPEPIAEADIAETVTTEVLILGGGIANIYDRIKHGFVTDYINFPKAKIKKLSKIIYNIGDFCVFIGAVLAAIFDR